MLKKQDHRFNEKASKPYKPIKIYQKIKIERVDNCIIRPFLEKKQFCQGVLCV